MPKKRKKPAGVSTSSLADSLGCSVDHVYKLREMGVFKSGRKNHYWIINPLAYRKTYRWNLEKCIETLEDLENEQKNH